MISCQRFDIQTDTGGDFQALGAPLTGRIASVCYQRDTGAPLDTGADFTLRLVSAGVVIADYPNAAAASWSRSPRLPAYDTGGTAISGQSELFPVAHDRLQLTVAQSDGVAGVKKGTIFVWVR